MKRPIILTGMLAIALIASACERQVSAQNNLSAIPTPTPAEPGDHQLFLAPSDPGHKSVVPDLPSLPNPDANIGDAGARQKALEIAAKQHGENNPSVTINVAVSYAEAIQLLPQEAQGLAPIGEAGIPARVVAMEGSFKPPQHSGPPGVQKDTRTAKKLYLILRAADGLLLETTLEYDKPSRTVKK